MQQPPNVAIIDHDEPRQPTSLASHVAQLAVQLDYNGTLNIGALEDEIRFYQQRSVEACLELGKRLLILKEITPHGEFIQRIELLGFSDRMARKFMSATLKFSNRNSSSVLKAAGTQTKLLELVALDDDDISELSEGGTVAGLTLDSIETMSVRELKKALRDARADIQAKDQLVENKNKKIDELDTSLTRLSNPSAAAKAALADQRESEALKTLSEINNVVLTAILQYQNQIGAMQTLASKESIASLHDRIEESVTTTFQRIAQVSADLFIPIDFRTMVNPDWMNLPDLKPQSEIEG